MPCYIEEHFGRQESEAYSAERAGFWEKYEEAADHRNWGWM